MAPSERKAYFLMLSDTDHQDLLSDDDGQRDPRWTLDTILQVDAVLRCGDLTNMSSIPDHVATLIMLSVFRSEQKSVIAGNHDISLDSGACQRSPEML